MWLKNWLNNKTFLIYFIITVIGLTVRFYGTTTPAQPYDIGTFHAWADHMHKVGPKDFYSTTWSDYLPLPLYSLVPIVKTAIYFESSFPLVFKIIVSLTELALIVLICKFWTYKNRLLLFFLLMLSPAFIGDTSFWGQIDTIPALLTLLSFVLLGRSTPLPKHIISSAILFGLAVAIKPIVVLTAPVLWIIGVKHRAWWQLPLIGPLVLFATGYPMAGLSAPKLLWERAMEQAGTYPYTTINAWNMWSVVPHPSSWPPDNQVVFGLSGHTTGLILFTIMFLASFWSWYKSKWDAMVALRLASTILIVFFTFTTRMHERHLLFGLPLLSAAAVLQPWLLLPLFILTLNFTLNLHSAFYWVINAQTWPFDTWLTALVSWSTTIVALLLTFVWDWPKYFVSIGQIIKSHKILVTILVLGSCLRLINLSYPPDYVFDEVYHAFTSREFLHNRIEAWEWWTTPPEGVAYEWTHPPVAKYGMVLGMLFFGENSLGWRIGSAAFGIMSILGIYMLSRALKLSNHTALIAAFLVSVEGLHIAQSRIAMNDLYMLNFYIWALYLAVKSRWKGAAILYGLSLASKWSALYGVIPLAVIYLYENPIKLTFSYWIRNSIYAFRLLLITVAVYVLSFAPFIVAGHTWEQWWELHRQMWYYHTHLVATHGYQSTPKEWIFDVRPVWYYVKYMGDRISNIYAHGNPVLLWLGLVAAIMQIKKVFTYPTSIAYLLYFMFTLPWIFSPRIMFFYHYLPSSVFLCMLLATFISGMPKRSVTALLVLCSLSLVWIAPMIFGIPMSTQYWDALFKIFPSWK